LSRKKDGRKEAERRAYPFVIGRFADGVSAVSIFGVEPAPEKDAVFVYWGIVSGLIPCDVVLRKI
jgi:hypothetical protein